MPQELGPYDTKLDSQEESRFQIWKSKYAPKDSGFDYDLRGAYQEGLKPDPITGHWPDTYKKPNHPTFSNESKYAIGTDTTKAGYWAGPNRDVFIPPINEATINKDMANKFIRTNPQNNWGIPQDAQINPRSGMLSQLQDLVYSSDAGRKAMGAIDTFNKFTGGPDLGNVTPGTSHAITPALESLSSEGLIKKAMDLFGKDRGYFMDKSADIYDLGHMYAPSNLTHPEVLDKIGQLPYEYHAGQPVGYDLPQGLDQTNLMRVRRGSGVTGIETTQKPSNAMMEQLMRLFEKEPTTGASLELHDLSNQRKLDQFFPNPQHAIDAIYNFFK